MARGKKTGGRNIKPGQVLNPAGGGAVSPTTRALRKVTSEHIEDVADIILSGDLKRLAALSEGNAEGAGTQISVLKVWLAAAAAEGIKKGDLHALELILNRVLGRPKQTFLHAGHNGGPIQTETKHLAEMADDEVEQKYQEFLAKARKGKA